MKRLLLPLFLFLSMSPSFAQKQGEALIDSLRSVLQTSAEDTSRVRALGRLSFQYFSRDTDLGVEYGEQALRLAEKLHWGTGIAFSNNYLGTNYAVKGNYPKALEYFSASLSKYTEIGDKQGIAFLSNNLGNLYRMLNEFPKAIDLCRTAERLNEELKNKTELVKVYNNLGSIYTVLSDYPRSNEYYAKALAIAREGGNKEQEALLLINIAENKSKTKDYCEALELGTRALKISGDLNNPYDRAMYNGYIGEIYLKIASDSGIAPGGCRFYSADRRKNLLSARSYLSVALGLLEKIDDLSLVSETSLSLSRVYEQLGDAKNALAFYKKYSANKDSVFSKDHSVTIANIEKKREIEVRDKQIIIQTLEIDKKNSQLVSQIVISALLLLLTSFFIYFYHKRKSVEKETKSAVEKRKADEAFRESEERYRVLYDDAPVGLYRTTPDGTIVLANRTLCKMLGFSSFEELSFRDLGQSGFESPDSRNQFREQIETNGEVVDLEGRWIRRDGTSIRVKENAKVIRDPHGTVLYYDGTVEDITERIRLEQQLLQAQKLEGVGTLAGGIAHDFNNLLAMVLGSAELLQRQLSDQPGLKKYTDSIIDAAERGTSISRQLLMFSRPDQIKLGPISLSRAIAELREMLKHFLPKSIVIETAEESGNAMIMGDAGQIHQALLNLALNAGDAMTNAGTLTIKEFLAAPEFIAARFSVVTPSPYVAVSVSDTGAGMDEAMIAKIFDPFFSTKESGKGTGLGLAMVHGIMKNHNGIIDVASVPGSGSTFTLYFPAVPQAANVSSATDTHPQQPQAGMILLVDDEVALREMLSEYLSGAGYTVHPAGNGGEALEYFRSAHDAIDLVITDLGMPGMGGEELYGELRKIDPGVKVIVSSGYLDGTTKHILLETGIRGVLTKPYRFNAIGDEITRVLSDHLTPRGKSCPRE